MWDETKSFDWILAEFGAGNPILEVRSLLLFGTRTHRRKADGRVSRSRYDTRLASSPQLQFLALHLRAGDSLPFSRCFDAGSRWATFDVIVDEPHCLHEGVGCCGPHKAEATLLQIT